jgi:signal transduction histidine kinase/ketosteroid isomerase-like protein
VLGRLELPLVAMPAFWWEDPPRLPAAPWMVGTHRYRLVGTPPAGQHAVNLRSLVARHHKSFNDRDLDALSTVFDEDVELVVDGSALHGVAAALGHASAIFREFPRLRIHDDRVVAESGDTIVVEHQLLNGEPSGGPLRSQGSVCEVYRARDGHIVAYRSYYMPEGADREDVVNVPSRVEGSKLAEEQAALRRVATLVARGVSQDELFAAVNEEIGWLVGADPTSLMRFEAGDTVTLVAAWSAADAEFPIGARRPVDDALRSLRDDGRTLQFGPGELPREGAFVTEARQLAIRSAVGVPIVVNGLVWGGAFAATIREEPFPDDTNARIAGFTELVATAIGNAESRAALARLAEAQAALRRVATLVARGGPPDELFAAVTEEVGRLFFAELATMCRYESDGTYTIVAGAGTPFPVGSRWPLGGRNLATLVSETGRPVRIEDYASASGPLFDDVRAVGGRSAVGTPIVVEDRLWGAAGVVTSRKQPLAADTEARLTSFMELVATAIANTEARTEVGRLVDEQAALRRVATLVARGTRPEEVFAAVTEEVGRLLAVDLAMMCRYEPDRLFAVVATWGRGGEHVPVGSRWPLGGQNLGTLVFETGRPARIDDLGEATGPLAEGVREDGVRSAVATPIIVEGRVWGLMVAASSEEQPLPPDTEARLASFTELVATAIVNTEAKTEVAASRARIVAATDEERRRVVRDLHDGAQQRLVHTMLTLKVAQSAMHDEAEDLPALLTKALESVEQANVELRELAHGILPGILSRGGLRAGVDALAARMPVLVENDVAVGRLPAAVEATAYFVVAEALTNVTKHARAKSATVTARVEDRAVHVQVRDDGIGGAQPAGSGLLGLADRLAALNGRFRVESPAGGGTLVAADIPIPG